MRAGEAVVDGRVGHGEKIVAALEADGVEFTNGKQPQTKRPPLPTLCGSSIVLI